MFHADHAPSPAETARYAARAADWRCGAVVYQVLVDRFAPPADLAAKSHLYPAPRQLMAWTDPPRPGRYLDDARLWSHELQFWGGDLASTTARLGHVRGLGADVLYLNPVHLAWTNHKYDALDHRLLSPEFGTRDDFRALAQAVHGQGMQLVLDGVFNHMGRQAPVFLQAQADPASPYRSWFSFGDQFAGGARSWWQAQNLPELNLENPAVRAYLYGGPDSVVRQWLRDGADGWRLDVAVDIGPRYLAELRAAAHAEKPGALVVGEIASYPSEWFGAVDAVMQFTLRQVLLRLAAGTLDGATAMRMVHRMVDDCGIDNMLRSWIFLDNHDTPRLASALPDPARRRLAQVLQCTLPGAPNLYYGSEVGMEGGDDPAMRAPMRWDLVDAGHPELDWTRRLVALHQGQRALRIGDLRAVTSHRLIGFERHTERVADTVLVIANPTDQTVTEAVMTGNPRLMNPFALTDLLGNAPAPLRMCCGMVELTLPPQGVVVLQPEVAPAGGYSSYKRVP